MLHVFVSCVLFPPFYCYNYTKCSNHPVQHFKRHLTEVWIQTCYSSEQFVLNDFDSNYHERLKKCGLLPLTFRRELVDLVFIYNSYHDLNDFVFDQYVYFKENNLRDGNNFTMACNNFNIKTECLMGSYIPRVTRL